jgi:hypothetical protein
MNGSRITFKEARLQHHITLHQLIEDTQIDTRAVLLMDTYNLGTPEHIDQLLASLTRLSGTEYSRRAKNIRDVTFKLYPDYSSISEDDAKLQIENDQKIQEIV